METSKPVRVSLLGCGTVGGGVLRLLKQNGAYLASRIGAPLVVRKVLVRDLARERDEACERAWLTTRADEVIDDPEVDILVEVMGGEHDAGALIERAIGRGLGVVTANKMLLAKRGPALIDAAVRAGVDLAFEASVGGGIPVIRTLREALTTDEKGPKVIVASSECMLNRQRREKPLVDKAIKGGTRVVKPKFGVDEDICTGDHACMRLSGCPSLSVKSLDDPLRDDPVAHIDQSCVGCGNCGEVADAAVLCPSFYRADVVHNPNRWDRFLEAARRATISLLQRRRESRRLTFADA